MKLRKFPAYIAICLVLVLALLPTAANASGSISFSDLIAAAFSTGTCGDHLNWTLDATGTLTIYGTGPMDDFLENEPTWAPRSAFIETVIIKDGVTTIGANAFKECTELTEITIPTGMTAVGEDAFGGCNSLSDVFYGGTQAQWDEIAVNRGNESLLQAKLHLSDAVAGDVDGNETLNTDDAVYLLLHVMFGSQYYPTPAGVSLDFDGNGDTNTDDAVYLLLHVMFGEQYYPLTV